MIKKLTNDDEKHLELFIKDWIKVHGYSQKDLADQLNISSSRTAAILIKMRELYRKGGMFSIAKKLIEIEQTWLLNNSSHQMVKKEAPYSQLDINYQIDLDNLINQMDKDHKQ
tara:strand:- start:12 stop:350 length:339 start_codon:yes stop_codon:yes gene_type:complete